MKQLYYTMRSLIHQKGNSLIKVLSLSLGLLVGIILFARVAFEMSYDKFYPDHERLYTITCLYTIGGEEPSAFPVVNAPMPPAFNEEIPEIEYATVTDGNWGNEKSFKYNGEKLRLHTIHADSLFFKTVGITILQGDDRMLGVRNNAFISHKMAKNIFGEIDPVGQVLQGDANINYTIQGVFEDIPENSHFHFDLIGSFITQYGPEYGWSNGDRFRGYVRRNPNVDPQVIDRKMEEVIRRNRDIDAERAEGFVAEYYLTPVSELHSGRPDIKRMCLILSLLATAILIIATMNYVLISISSLANRAKAVGIHKCNGASAGKIFNMFMQETAVLVTISLAFALVLLLAFRGFIENITDTSFAGLFSTANLWIPVVLIAIIFLLAGYAPARILSSIPVTQVFRVVAVNKKYWKRGLLFVQFSGVTFILVLLMVILVQYKTIVDKDLGYEPDGVVYTWLDLGWEEGWQQRMETVKQEFLRVPYVSHAANHNFPVTYNFSGTPTTDEEGNSLFTMRFNGCDFDYIRAMGIRLIEGTDFTAEGQVVVNETFVRLMGWMDSALGKEVRSGNWTLGTVVGVAEDFPVSSLHNEQAPVVLTGSRYSAPMMTLRIAGFSSDKLSELNQKISDMFPDQIKEFTVLDNILTGQYKKTRQFRDSVVAAFFIVLLITAMGLFGYISDEVTRRSKEIAIRKVNGATADRILQLLYKDISYLSLPAIVVGIVGAVFVGSKWLEDFAVKVPLTPQLFIVGAAVVFMVIFTIVTIRTWRVANENPVKSIKSE